MIFVSSVFLCRMKYKKLKIMKTLFKTWLPVLIITGSFTACTGDKAEEGAEAAIEENESLLSDDDKEADADFLKEVAAISYTEIELGKLAQEKGTIQDVKDLGK